MSTDASDGRDRFDPEHPYELSPDVALRREPFGALAYSYACRRLSVVRSGLLVSVLNSLAQHDSARAAMAEAGVAPESTRTVSEALASLLASGVIRAR